jgi:hypothetical protein
MTQFQTYLGAKLFTYTCLLVLAEEAVKYLSTRVRQDRGGISGHFLLLASSSQKHHSCMWWALGAGARKWRRDMAYLILADEILL